MPPSALANDFHDQDVSAIDDHLDERCWMNYVRHVVMRNSKRVLGRRFFCVLAIFVVVIAILFVVGPESGWAAEKKVARPRPAALLRPTSFKDRFEFETDDIQGTIRLDGPYHGVTRLVDKRTKRQVIDPRYSALNLFKLMSINQIMGQPRHMKRTTRIAPRWVEIKWAATDSHKAELTARYEVVKSNAIDLTVTVRSQGAYAGYELFLSNYFDKVLRPQVYLDPGSRKMPIRVTPMVSDVFRGTVLVFPRDAHAARRCLDGRWERNERHTPTVQMCPVRHYLYCLALLTDPDNQLGVVLMSHPRDCYAISTRYFADNDADRLTSYSAFDHSLFGDNFLPGQTRTVKVRLAVTRLDRDLSQPLKMYREFIASENKHRTDVRSTRKE